MTEGIAKVVDTSEYVGMTEKLEIIVNVARVGIKYGGWDTQSNCATAGYYKEDMKRVTPRRYHGKIDRLIEPVEKDVNTNSERYNYVTVDLIKHIITH
jgi:hypothetical protein